MALIVLDPGETFEHQHGGDSETTLLDGEVVLTMGTHSAPLRAGHAVTVSASQHHSMRNTGDGTATVRCRC